MTLTIPDEVVKQTGLSERELLIEIACRLFAAQKLYKAQAGRLCGLSRLEFEDELHKRGLPVIIYTLEMLEEDRKTLDKLEALQRAEIESAGRQ